MNETKTALQPLACPHTQCGGCTATSIPYEAQLAKKHRSVKHLLAEFGTVSMPLAAEGVFHYRNKVTRSYMNAKNKAGKPCIVGGIYAKDSRRIVPIAHCQIEDAGAQAIFETLEGLCNRMKLRAFDAKTGQGVLRHAQIRASSDGKYLLTLVTGTAFFPGRAELVAGLRAAHPEVVSIVHNVNGFDTGMILGDPMRTGTPDRVLFGRGFVTDTLCGLRFSISPQSFYQVNHAGTEILYGTAIDFADIRPGDTVLDAYCGIGTIGLAAMKRYRESPGDAEKPGGAVRLVGVEINRDAVHDAMQNARENHIADARFYAGDAGKFMSEGRVRPDVLFMDPPRAGSDEAFLSAVLRAKPRTVVYVSCNPETLARDLKVLTKGYRVEKIQPVDMFPMTEHCECAVLLHRKKVDNSVRIAVHTKDLKR